MFRSMADGQRHGVLMRRRTELLASAGKILERIDAEDRNMTVAETQEYESAMAEIDKQIDPELRRLSLEVRSSNSGAPPFNMDGEPGLSTATLHGLDRVGDSSRIVTAPHSGVTLKAFPNDRNGRESAYRMGHWVGAALLQNPRSIAYCRNAGLLSPDIHMAHREGVSTQGGALVPDELSSTVIRLVEQFGVFRTNTRVIPTSSDSIKIPRRRGGLAGFFVGESQSGTEADSSWDQVELVPKKFMILSRLSSELNDDNIVPLVDILAQECALSLAQAEDRVGFTGTGISTDGGMQGLIYRFEHETLAGAIAAASGHDTVLEVDLDDLLSLVGKLPQYAQRNAKWFVSPAVFASVFSSIAASTGGATVRDLQNGMGMTFLGFPVVTSSLLPSNLSANYGNKVMLLFGDLTQSSTLAARRELRFQVADQIYWTTDEIGLRATARFSIVNHDLGDDTNAGPMVALMGKT